MITLPRLRIVLFGVMVLAALAVAALNLRFLVEDIGGIFHRAIDQIGHNDLELYLHLYTAPLILLVGPLLFIGPLRRRHPVAHRWAGRVYLATVLVTSMATLDLAFDTTEGPLTVFGFSALSILWFLTAAFAWTRAMQGRFADHNDWMIRNYAMTLTNVTFRVELHAMLWLGVDFDLVYEPLRALQFLPNLILAELLIRARFFSAESWRDLGIGLRPAPLAPPAQGNDPPY